MEVEDMDEGEKRRRIWKRRKKGRIWIRRG